MGKDTKDTLEKYTGEQWIEYMKKYGDLCRLEEKYKHSSSEWVRGDYLSALYECMNFPEGLLKKLRLSREELKKKHMNTCPSVFS